MNSTDAVLLERWQRQRDADAFAELVQRYSAMVFASCKRILNNPARAEDVAQECFIELMRSRSRIRVSLGAWLHTMAVRRSIDRIKGDTQRRSREARFAAGQADVQDAPDASIAEILVWVDEAIEELPGELRTVVVARFLEGQSHTALARDLDVAESTVRYRIDRGVDRIRQALKRRGVAVEAVALTAALSQPAEAAPPSLAGELGKLAISGSLPPVSSAAISFPLALKVAVAILVVTAVGAGLWTVLGTAGNEKLAASTKTEVSVETSSEPMNLGASLPGPNAPSPTDPGAIPADTPQKDADVTQTPAGPANFSIQGRVFDAATGEGIAGVRAHAAPAGGGRMEPESEPTGSDGRYQLPPLGAGMYTVSLSDVEGYPDPRRSRHVSVTIKNGELVTGVDFSLEKGIRAAGTVIGPDGKPANGAEVGAKATGVPNPLLTKSDTEGRFALYLPDITDNLMVQAHTEDLESVTQAGLVLPREGIEGLALVLDQPRSGALSGVVTDRDGKGIDGAQLHLVHKSPRVFGYGVSGAADREGRFHIAKCEAGDYAIIVTPKEAQGFTTGDEQMRVTLAPGESVDGLVIVYGEKGGLAIAGRVVDGAGNPIGGVRISCFGDTMQDAYTKDDGAFTITGLKEMEYSLTAQHYNYSRASKTLLAGTLDAEFVLKAQGRLQGRVVRADTGAPLSAYKLSFVYGAVTRFEEMLFTSGRPIESADGTFSFDKLQAGPMVVAAWAPGFAPEWRNLMVEEKAATEVELRLNAVPRFEGLVVDEAGNPVAGAGVYFVEGVSADLLDRTVAARTDDKGRFALDSLPPDAAQVCAFHTQHGFGVSPLPGDGRITLLPTGIVEGRIEWEGGALTDMLVNARYPEARHLPQTYTRPLGDGTFRLTGLPPGELEISVYPNGGPRHTITRTVPLAKGQTVQLEFAFEKGTGAVEGTLTSGGEPVTQAWLKLERCLDDRTERLESRPDATGHYRFEGVWVGDLTLTVTRADPNNPMEPIKDEVELTLKEAEVLRQDITLRSLP